MKIFLILRSAVTILFLFVSLSTFGQVFSGNEANLRIKGVQLLKINEIRKTIDFVKLSPATQVEETSHLAWINSVIIDQSNSITLQIIKEESDNLGGMHYKYREFYKGIPVEYGSYTAHCKDGKLVSVSGEFYNNISTLTQPTLTKNQAFHKALDLINAKQYRFNISEELKNNSNGELVIIPHHGAFNLAYKFDIYAIEPLSREYIYVDAKTGDILFRENRIHTNDVPATAVTAYNGTQQITTDSLTPNLYRLRESGRGNGINTFNLQNGTDPAGAIDFTDNDNLWNTNTIDKYALDAHYGAEKTYDYFYSHYGRNSYDNAGATINSYVHFYTDYVNAFWDGTEMVYGDGNGINYQPLTSLEITGHEITHAITENTAGLIYADESGALNESFSDIFGNTIRFENSTSYPTWFIGDQIIIPGSMGTPFRNMANPNQYQCADTYGGTYWNLVDIVHHNSGVQNYWFYLLTNGGSGYNDLGHFYNIEPIGLTAAAAIAYRNLTVYLTPNSTFWEARFYSIQAAQDLYGTCSNEETQTTNAWYAVGVGSTYIKPIVANFLVDKNFFCTTPNTANFINYTSGQNNNSYNWDFGDGSPNSTLANPSHLYTSPGNYTVSLITIRNSPCYSIDTIIKTDYISLTNNGSPIPAQCTPSTTSYCCNTGIINVLFGNINNTSINASEGYQDFTCSLAANLTAGDPVSIDITTNGQKLENVKVWIDYDNDGIFNTTTEEVFVSLNKRYHHKSLIHTPITATLNTALRMRVMDDDTSNSSFNSCSNPQTGQAEDYSVIFTANTQAPQADFTSDAIAINAGGTVNFSDLTIHAPTSWNWSFPGAVTTSSNLQNPSIVYNSPGRYQVTLIATNSFGTDSILKTEYIDVLDSIILCQGTTFTTAPNGQFFDSGGSAGNYGPGEYCTLLISPECATKITLKFTQFSTVVWSGNLIIHNGTNSSGGILANLTASNLPSDVTCYSGNMFIEWSSDLGNTAPGFAAQWTSTIGNGNGLPPLAEFSTSTNNPLFATPVQFTDHSSNSPVAWNWDFGDGQTSLDQNPKHSYLAPGNYIITLISSNCASSDTITDSLVVQSSPVLAYNPGTLIANLNACDDTITVPIILHNNGSGDLVYSMNNGVNGNIRDTSILVIDRNNNYLFDIANYIQTNFNITPTLIYDSQIASTNFMNYDIIIIATLQNASSYHIISTYKTKFENYTNAGGIIQYLTASWGGSNPTVLAGGVKAYTTSSQTTNNGLLLNHPLLSGLTNPLNGNPANICSLWNLPAYTTIITTTATGNHPTTIEYPLGKGRVIATGMCWEALYDAHLDLGMMLPNSINYLFSNIDVSPTWLSYNSSSDTIAPGDSTIIYAKFYSGKLSGGTYTYDIILNTNDTNFSVDTLTVVLNVGFNPCTEYNYTFKNGCSGEVFFNDSSVNAQSWYWDFGDGDTSTLQNPQHTYQTIGTYNIKLVACNGNMCDSITKSILINNVNGPIPSCIPVSISTCCNIGINEVELNTLHKFSADGSVGYENFSCSLGTNLLIGGTYTIYVRTSNLVSENVRAWIDYDNSGSFDTTELILSSDTTLRDHSGVFTVPPSATAGNLRLRISSDGSNFPIPTPCGNPQRGQAEDYYILLTVNILPPVANFTSNATSSCNGLVQFTDISANLPTSYSWDFGDGTFSTLANPSHQYALAGNYTVQLIASNNFGADTITQSVNVAAFFTASPIATGVMLAGQVLQFTANAPGATGFVWNFGDSQTSTLQNPTHTYTSGGTYYVSLVISKPNCTSIGYDTLYLSGVGISELSAINSFNLSPNPFSSGIQLTYHLEKPGVVTLECSDVLGRITNLIINKEEQIQGDYSYNYIPTAAGVYYIKLTVNGESVTRKTVKIE